MKKNFSDITEQIQQYLFDSAETLEKCQAFADQMVELSNRMVKTFVEGHKVLIAGNGGSAADSQHIAGELISQMRTKKVRRGLPVIALPSSLSTLTAASNDFGYEAAIAREVDAFGQKGDILWVLSTSGNSQNILDAIAIAKSRQMWIVGFTGESGGAIGEFCDMLFNVPHTDTPVIQQCHSTMAHIICTLVEEQVEEREYLPVVKPLASKRRFQSVLKDIKKGAMLWPIIF
jgi:D-sedoheptulose 7-phosphate isomerase